MGSFAFAEPRDEGGLPYFVFSPYIIDATFV